MTSICIFCGAKAGTKNEYTKAAKTLVEELVRRDITLVYGGGNTGLMGVIANHALALGGKVIGVIPESLAEMEVAHEGLTELHYVADMHDRKKVLTKLSDGFIALPGGTGTLDEFFQEIALKQIGYHAKNCGLLNTDHYYDHLVAFLNHATDQGFLDPIWREFVVVNPSPAKLVTGLLELTR